MGEALLGLLGGRHRGRAGEAGECAAQRGSSQHGLGPTPSPGRDTPAPARRRPCCRGPRRPARRGGSRVLRSAGERLLRVEGREDLEVAEHTGQLVRRPRLAAVAAALGIGDQAEAAASLVLGDGQMARERVPVAGAARGAQAQAPAGDDHGVAGLTDLADLEDGRLTARAHGTLPSAAPGCGARRAVRRDPDPARRCRHCGVRWWYASSSARYTAWLSTCAACDREKSSHGAGGATRWDENRRPAGTLTWRPGGSTMVGSVRLDVAAAWCREPGKKYDAEVWGTRSCCLERELQTP